MIQRWWTKGRQKKHLMWIVSNVSPCIFPGFHIQCIWCICLACIETKHIATITHRISPWMSWFQQCQGKIHRSIFQGKTPWSLQGWCKNSVWYQLILLLMVQKSSDHRLILSMSHYLRRVSYMSGGCLGFPPSTVISSVLVLDEGIYVYHCISVCHCSSWR